MKQTKKPSQFLEIFLNVIDMVKANRYMSEEEKKSKINELKLIIHEK
jgi:hypothetical protein